MGLQLRDLQLQMQRQQGEQKQATGDQMESSPSKRPREQEPTEPRSLDTAPPGSQGVGMELNQEANVQGDVGYETVTFSNNTSTRYFDWLHCANAKAQKLSASVWEPSLSYTPLVSGDCMQGWADTHPGANPNSCPYANQMAGNGWDPGLPIELTDTIQSSQSHSKGARGEAGGRRNPVVGTEWTLNKISGEKVLSIDSLWDPVRHGSLTHTGRSKQI